MRVQLLPSTFDEHMKASMRQHLMTLVIDDKVAIDAGCLALACTDEQRRGIRDVALTHTHLDHVAGLPMFIDDLFATLDGPVRIHATDEMITILEDHLFNWEIYPRFSELRNENGAVLEYVRFNPRDTFAAAHLHLTSVPVEHKVEATGYLVSDGASTIAVTGDTKETDEFWQACSLAGELKSIFVECAFPNELQSIADVSDHLTPSKLASELAKLSREDVPVYLINIKPMYRERVVKQVQELARADVQVMEVGRVYEF